ncbi:MAG: nucleoside hydrolase [Bacteroidota bacterium]
MNYTTAFIYLMIALTLWFSCGEKESQKSSGKEIETQSKKIPVIFDTDANNELDDQHALIYLLFNGNSFDVRGVTVNATYNGGEIDGHYEEAERIMTLANLEAEIPLIKGANDDFSEIRTQLGDDDYDGKEAIDFIISEAYKSNGQRLVLLAVGKLTNIALAVEKDPGIIDKVRVVWLGSNYPKPGEYNQDNDTASMNFLLNTPIAFEMVTVRYGDPSGTDFVKVTQEEINREMPGLGPGIEEPITGRHGGIFSNFGDYSVSLFTYIDYHGDPPSRPLFDMAAVAIVKEPSWAKVRSISAPVLKKNEWVERPDNKREILIWEHFDRDAIIADFYQSLKNPVPVSAPN